MVLIVLEICLEVLWQILLAAELNVTVLLGTFAIIGRPELTGLIEIHFDIAEIVLLYEGLHSRKDLVIVELVDAFNLALTVVNAIVQLAEALVRVGWLMRSVGKNLFGKVVGWRVIFFIIE